MEIKFKKPFIFEGEEHTGITLELDNLSGSNLEEAQRLIAVEGKSITNLPEMNKAYCAQVAAFAAKKPVEFIRALPAREYVRVTLEVQNFLLDGAS